MVMATATAGGGTDNEDGAAPDAKGEGAKVICGHATNVCSNWRL